MSADKQLFTAVYVNDLLIFCLDVSRLEDVQQRLQDRFKMTDLEIFSTTWEYKSIMSLARRSLSAKVLVLKKYSTALR